MLKVHIDWPDEVDVRHRADIITLVEAYCVICDEENVPDSIAYNVLDSALEQCGLEHTIEIEDNEEYDI